PVPRGGCWLELHGAQLGDGGPQVPAAIAAQVFETQEKLEELRAGGTADLRREIEKLRDRFADRVDALPDELVGRSAAAKGGAPSLDEVGHRLAEIAYLRTLLG